MIKTEHLSKRYEALTAVDDVSFEVQPGEVLGFLGPNGAGKTTTMRMLAGFISPTSGTASICGHDIETDTLAAKASIGYLPEGAPTYGEMTVYDFLQFIADLRKLGGEARTRRLSYVVGRLQLERVLAGHSPERLRQVRSELVYHFGDASRAAATQLAEIVRLEDQRAAQQRHAPVAATRGAA